jgi:hypothetical protein
VLSGRYLKVVDLLLLFIFKLKSELKNSIRPEALELFDQRNEKSNYD